MAGNGGGKMTDKREWGAFTESAHHQPPSGQNTLLGKEALGQGGLMPADIVLLCAEAPSTSAANSYTCWQWKCPAELIRRDATEVSSLVVHVDFFFEHP